MSNKKVGGIRFIRIGRLNLSISMAKAKRKPTPDAAMWMLDGLAATAMLAAFVAIVGA